MEHKEFGNLLITDCNIAVNKKSALFLLGNKTEESENLSPELTKPLFKLQKRT
jgi:hypothetical protein